MTTLAPGQLFAGRYRVDRPLASGGMGAVYVATHLATEAQVALKVLLPHRLESESARERLREEARVAARARSEHIVRVLDAGLDGATDMPFFAMELLEGRSLADEVAARGRCTRVETALYMRHVASGLDRAHGYIDAQGVRRPIVHRDLKPENLFLTQRDDGSPLVKILDFGIAKLTSASADFSRDLKGTPEYMAIEQIRGEPVSTQTDIWSLGLTAFFLLSGRCYWRSVNEAEGDMQLLFQELLTPNKPAPSARIRELGLEPSWTGAFDVWFARCVATDPRERFQSAGAAVRTLEQLLQYGPPEATRMASHDNPVMRSYVRPTMDERPNRRAATTLPAASGDTQKLPRDPKR